MKFVGSRSWDKEQSVRFLNDVFADLRPAILFVLSLRICVCKIALLYRAEESAL